MERPFDHQIEHARQQLILMASLVEAMLADATYAYEHRDSERAERTIRRDREVDDLELSIQADCQKLLALRQPLASDLRFILSAMQMTTDLERIGDCTGNIGQSLLELHKEPQLETLPSLRPLTLAVQDMVRNALDAFVRSDLDLARQTWKSDDGVDDLYSELFSRLESMMGAEPQAVNRGLHLILIARHLERIADHASNVCEEVVYSLSGRDIRHSRTLYEPKA